jgi:hypothetical protein
MDMGKLTLQEPCATMPGLGAGREQRHVSTSVFNPKPISFERTVSVRLQRHHAANGRRLQRAGGAGPRSKPTSGSIFKARRLLGTYVT